MKKLFFAFAATLLLLSCSNEQVELASNGQKAIEVVTLPTSNAAGTRVSNGESQVLKFKDESVYEQTVAKIRKMSIPETLTFFEELGFDGAYTQLKNAENELDSLFDIEDDAEFVKAITSYKQKYTNKFVFNEDDIYDLSPYLPYSDADMELVGNLQGQVMIGNQIVKAQNYQPDYKENELSFTTPSTAAEIRLSYRPYGESSLMIKEGKYQSTVQLGYDANGGSLAIQLTSQKKKKLWKRRHECDYTLDITIGNLQWKNYYQANEKQGMYQKFLMPLVNKSYFNVDPKCGYSNFRSGCCPNQRGSKAFTLEISRAR